MNIYDRDNFKGISNHENILHHITNQETHKIIGLQLYKQYLIFRREKVVFVFIVSVSAL